MYFIKNFSITFRDIFSGIISKDEATYNHSHNLFMEIAFNFGIPVSIILSITIVIIVWLNFRNLILSKNINNNSVFNIPLLSF